MNSLGKAWTALFLMLGLLVALVPGCDKVAQARPAVVLTASELAQRPALYGGDTESWLTDRGGNNDGGYCAAKLRLPLATEPSWEFAYSAAEFSNKPVSTIVHYAGQIFLTARCPQLVMLDALSGKVLLNKDVYAHQDIDVSEELRRVYAHPQGLLLGQDNLGRFYASDMLDRDLRQLWVSPEFDTEAGFVTDGELMLTSWGDQLYGVDVLSGKLRWQQPSVSPPGGVVLSRSGFELWWSSEGRLFALQADNGALLWSITSSDLIERAIIDDQQQLAYVVYGSEYLECRKLAEGDILWRYSWSKLLSETERKRMFEQVLARLDQTRNDLGWTGTNNRLDEIVLSPEGIILSLANGSALALDGHGVERWRYDGQAPITRMIAFENAVLIGSLFVRPEVFPWERAVFCLNEPDWPKLKETRAQQAQVAVEVSTEQQQDSQESLTPPAALKLERKEMFYRFTALDLATGKEVSSFEPVLLPASALVPARSNVVFTEAPVSWAVVGESGRGRKLRVLAYPWIEWEGN